MSREIRINLLIKESIYPELTEMLKNIPEKDRAEKVRTMLNEMAKGLVVPAGSIAAINHYPVQGLPGHIGGAAAQIEDKASTNVESADSSQYPGSDSSIVDSTQSAVKPVKPNSISAKIQQLDADDLDNF